MLYKCKPKKSRAHLWQSAPSTVSHLNETRHGDRVQGARAAQRTQTALPTLIMGCFLW